MIGGNENFQVWEKCEGGGDYPTKAIFSEHSFNRW